MADEYIKGTWNATCDVCKFDFKAKELKKRWDGMMVCKDDWETRHPSDFARAREERSAIPWARPDDTEGNITIINITSGVPYLIGASLEDTLYYLTTKGGSADRTVSLPDPNNAEFKGINVIYKITLMEEDEAGTASQHTITINNTLGSGSTTIAIGATAIFESSATNNLWYRVA